MLEVRLDFDSKNDTNKILGEFTIGEAAALCDLLKKYPILAMSGHEYTAKGIHFDAGPTPHMYIFCELTE